MSVTIEMRPGPAKGMNQSVDLKCECGWEGNFLKKNGYQMAMTHVRDTHSGKGGVREIRTAQL